MMMKKIVFPGVTTLFVVVIIPYIRITHGQIVEMDNILAATNSKTDIDFETLSLFGVTAGLAEQFKANLLKAIETEGKIDRDLLRQGEFGGVSGGFYQGGNAGINGAGGTTGGNQEEDGDEEEEDEVGSTTTGPGAFGVLSGLFGIFSGLGTLNPTRIIQSTVNFFPPGQRMQAQMIVDSLIGYVPPENRTISRPRTTPTSVILNETVMAIPMTNENSTVIEAKTNEKGNAKDAENTRMANNTTTFYGIGSGKNQEMAGLGSKVQQNRPNKNVQLTKTAIIKTVERKNDQPKTSKTKMSVGVSITGRDQKVILLSRLIGSRLKRAHPKFQKI